MQVHIHIRMCYLYYSVCAATKQRLEQELAEAAQEDEGSVGSGDTSSKGEGEEIESGSDSEGEGEGRESGKQPTGTQMQNSLEMSIWSLDVSIPSGMESSVYETEVNSSICLWNILQRPVCFWYFIYYRMLLWLESGTRSSPSSSRRGSGYSRFYSIQFLYQFPDLTSFLLARASRSTRLANYFYWYLSVECSEGKDKLKYDKIRLKFLEGLNSVSCAILTIHTLVPTVFVYMCSLCK